MEEEWFSQSATSQRDGGLWGDNSDFPDPAVPAKLARVAGDEKRRERGARPNPLFEATRWSIVQRARDDSIGALNELFTQYRRPLVIYLQARGVRADEAEESVQGFCKHLLSKDFLVNVAPEKGLFRTFLLDSLLHYLCDEHRQATAQKRGGGQTVASLDETGQDGKPLYTPAANAPTADQEYDRAWARTVLEQALRRLAQECATTGHARLLEALEPALFADETASSYREIAGRLGMTEGAVKVAAHRIRLRLRGLVRDEILQTVSNEGDWETELRYLITLFGR